MRRILRTTAGVLAAAFASFLGLLALRRAWSAVLARRPARAMPEADGDDELPVLRGGRSSSTPREPTELVPTHAAPWALPGEEAKDGVGMLFFAYGGTKQVDAFLAEATAAAASIREFNPNLSIAIVTNNASVNRRVFTTHIVPRDDLVFPGSTCPDVCRPDHVARQWTTRLYYMALSPYRITWALDSNTMQCPGERAHGAIHRFLLAAERTAMWGVDIAHANLLNPLHAPMGAHAAARRNLMSPHCFSLLWKWNGRTSNVFRDWFMLMLRRGVATNDQEPLRYAEVRQQRMGAGGLTVGQIPTEFAGSLYTVWPGRGRFYPRISRTVRGFVQIVHAPPVYRGALVHQHGASWCRAFNLGFNFEASGAARVRGARPVASRAGLARQLVERKFGARLLPVTSEAECARAVRLPNVTDAEWERWYAAPSEGRWRCPLAGGGMSDPRADGELLHASLPERLDASWWRASGQV